MIKVIILAGGLATRMLPLTEQIPKCMIDVYGKPLIEHQIREFKRQGFTEFIICVSHLAYKVREFLKDGEWLGVKITYKMDRLSGTAGSVKLTESLIDDDFIVYYGDNLTRIDFHKLIKAHDSLATIVMRRAPVSSMISIGRDRQIKKFIEKPKVYVNSGIYVFSKDIFKYIPEEKTLDFSKDIFPSLIGKIHGYPTDEYFRELGTVQKYNAFLEEKRKAVFLDRDGVIIKDVDRLTKPSQVKLLPLVSETIETIISKGYLPVIITNQPNIAKGFLTFTQLQAIHDKMNSLLSEPIEHIYVCPHHPEKGFTGEIEHLKIKCDCRKPEPGLILQAAKELNIDLGQSWMVGNNDVDIVAGKKAGCNIYKTSHLYRFLRKINI